MTDQQESPCRILVLASGFGSNFQALINAIAIGRIPNSHIIGLVTNRRNVHATARAEGAGKMSVRNWFNAFLTQHEAFLGIILI